jgi:xylan 1,4-beta-xylosidase
MNYHGVAKPAYRCFQLFHETRDKRYRVVSSNPDATVEAAAFSIPNGIRVIAYNFNVAGAGIKDERIRVELSNGKQPKNISVQRIDNEHCNPKQCWIDMGSPKYINAEQLEQLHRASELRKERLDSLDVVVPANGMCAIDIEL